MSSGRHRVAHPVRRYGRMSVIVATVFALNVFGWGGYVLLVMPHQLHYAGLGIGLGVAVTAWTLGARHAFDADHISAIDNTTRKLVGDGRSPSGIGFFFSVGHSAVVVAVGGALTIAARPVFGAVVDPGSTFELVGGSIGTVVSAGFLYLIAALNIGVLAGLLRVFREVRGGAHDEEGLEHLLHSRGLIWRLAGRLTGSSTASWRMVLVGVVFGIGFDTATEVVLLAATAYAATEGLAWYAVLALPILFAGGLTLFDTLDGVFMNSAYGWAAARPVRRAYYNLVITGLSVAAAFLIGTIEVLGVLTAEVHLHGAFWSFMSGFNINRAGFVIAGLFAAVWAAAVAVWRFGDLERRWSPAPEPETG
jgi:high-affinity nickel-transport protein